MRGINYIYENTEFEEVMIEVMTKLIGDYNEDVIKIIFSYATPATPIQASFIRSLAYQHRQFRMENLMDIVKIKDMSSHYNSWDFDRNINDRYMPLYYWNGNVARWSKEDSIELCYWNYLHQIVYTGTNIGRNEGDRRIFNKHMFEFLIDDDDGVNMYRSFNDVDNRKNTLYLSHIYQDIVHYCDNSPVNLFKNYNKVIRNTDMKVKHWDSQLVKELNEYHSDIFPQINLIREIDREIYLKTGKRFIRFPYHYGKKKNSELIDDKWVIEFLTFVMILPIIGMDGKIFKDHSRYPDNNIFWDDINKDYHLYLTKDNGEYDGLDCENWLELCDKIRTNLRLVSGSRNIGVRKIWEYVSKRIKKHMWASDYKYEYDGREGVIAMFENLGTGANQSCERRPSRNRRMLGHNSIKERLRIDLVEYGNRCILHLGIDGGDFEVKNDGNAVVKCDLGGVYDYQNRGVSGYPRWNVVPYLFKKYNKKMKDTYDAHELHEQARFLEPHNRAVNQFHNQHKDEFVLLLENYNKDPCNRMKIPFSKSWNKKRLIRAFFNEGHDEYLKKYVKPKYKRVMKSLIEMTKDIRWVADNNTLFP